MKTLLFLLLCFFGKGVAQATVTPIQELDFGVIAITNNNSPASISIDPNGNIQVVGGIAIIEEGNQAIYELSDMPTNRTLDVDVLVLNPTMLSDISTEESFAFSLIRNSTTVFIDDSGIGLLFIGGKIQTSGSGNTGFSDTNFNSTIQITINL
jgi:hypothetical protein